MNKTTIITLNDAGDSATVDKTPDLLEPLTSILAPNRVATGPGKFIQLGAAALAGAVATSYWQTGSWKFYAKPGAM